MKQKSFLCVCCVALGCATGSFAATFDYDFAGSGGWAESSRWGTEGSHPGAGDTIRIGSGEVIVADADIGVLEAVGEVALQNADTVLVISNDTDIALSVHVSGNGKVVKKGDGRITVSYAASEYPFSNPGGWEVRDGEVRIENPNSVNVVRFVYPLAIYAPARFVFGFVGGNLQIRGLAGDGTIVNENDEAREINFYAFPLAGVCEFSGTVEGKFKYYGEDTSRQRFSGPGRAVIDSSLTMYQAYLGADGFPASGFVFRDNGEFEYTGSGGAVSSEKNWHFNNQAKVLKLSAGPFGGCTVKYAFINPGDKYTMNELVLCGDNVQTAVFDGTFKMGQTQDKTQYLACYLKKTGAGTWRFTSADKANRGTVAVEKGTLEYESMAERGTSCSLGDASILHSEYTGARDDSKAVPYAYLLGDGTLADSDDATVATMKYVGESAVSVTGRAVVVKGSARFSSASALLNWHGFSSIATGDNELILGGAAEGCSAFGVTDGIGRLSVVKDGTGDWTVDGESSFTGRVEAREGTLRINACRNYGWYKLTLKDNWRPVTGAGDGGTIWITQFGLFDADGTNWIENVLHNEAANGKVSILKPGEAALANTDFRYLNTDKETYSLDHAFTSDNTLFGGSRSVSYSAANGPLTNSATWVQIVVRPHETTNALVRYDIRQYGCAEYTAYRELFARDVRSWTLEGSMDGINWENLDTVISNANPTTGSRYKWIGTNDTGAHDAGEGLGPIAAGVSGSVLRPTSVAGVSAAAGATVKALGAVSAEGIKIDHALGAGTIEGFALAENGVVEIVNVPEDAGRFLEFPLSLVDVSGIERLSGYGVTINGKNKGWSCRYSNGVLRVDAPGTVVIFR